MKNIDNINNNTDYSQKKEFIKANDEILIFDSHKSDLIGSLKGSVKFAQSQIIPYRKELTDIQPYLTSLRKTLLLVRPTTNIEKLSVVIKDAKDTTISSLNLSDPDSLPKTVYNITDGHEKIYTISENDELHRLNDLHGVYLKEKLEDNTLVDIKTRNYNFVEKIYLPQNVTTGRIIKVSSDADHDSTIYYNDSIVKLTKGNSKLFIFSSGEWTLAKEQITQRLIYEENTWSIIIPAQYIKSGITMQFTSGDLSGVLEDIKVGAPTEMLFNTIDIGMLTPPRDKFTFANEPKTHSEYFQTIPVARLIVNKYQSLHLTEVMLPTGVLLKEFDPSQGGVYSGSMRQDIGKVLISLGINNANYGINSSGGLEKSVYLAAQMTAHNSIGKYANGVIEHGLSGGGGVVTLHSSVGNEFSHEVGHNYGLGHYPGGFNGSVHRPESDNNSMWGWDSVLNLFIPNFRSEVTNKSTDLDSSSQPPFYGRSFGTDPMADGFPMTSLNRYTLYTPYTASIIQKFFESKMQFDRTSSTGFSKWDAFTQTMRPYTHRVDVLNPIQGPYENVTEDVLSALFVDNKYVIISMRDGAWSKNIHVPQASAANKGCILGIYHRAQFSSTLYINGTTVDVKQGFRRYYQSNGQVWDEVILIDSSLRRETLPKYNAQDLSESVMKEVLEQYNCVEINMKDGRWSKTVHIPPADQSNTGDVIIINHKADFKTTLYINGSDISIVKSDNRNFISDGTTWKEIQKVIDTTEVRKPQDFGVPVTTLVGYYDPEGVLTNYIYPALHGAYGYVYPDNSSIVTDSDWQLWVESGNETLRFLLDNHRWDKEIMNKFHINIPESAQARTAYLVHNGVKLVSKAIEPVSTALSYTTNGD